MKFITKQKKTNLIFFCIAPLFSIVLNAQSNTGFGVKGGLNYNGNGDFYETASNNYQNPDRSIGYHVGVFSQIGKKLYFRPELVYTSTKSNYKIGAFDFKKLDMPLLFGIKMIGPIQVFGGPSVQYVLNSDFENSTISDIENNFSVGLNFGFGISFNTLGVDLRYERGFNDNEARIINNNISVDNPNRLATRPEQFILSLSIML